MKSNLNRKKHIQMIYEKKDFFDRYGAYLFAIGVIFLIAIDSLLTAHGW